MPHCPHADCLEGVIELDAGAKVKRVNAEAGLLFGVLPSSLVGENIQKVRLGSSSNSDAHRFVTLYCGGSTSQSKIIAGPHPRHAMLCGMVAVQQGCLPYARPWEVILAQVLPRVCPGGRATELLAAHGQRGGSKQKIGAPQMAEGAHPDKHALHASLQAAESTERPGRSGRAASKYAMHQSCELDMTLGLKLAGQPCGGTGY